MELKEVIHYYIGCECEYDGILNGKEMGEELKANSDDIFYIPKIEQIIGTKRGILKSIEVDMKGGFRKAGVGRKVNKSFWGVPRFKPILRRLSSMTYDEFIEGSKIHLAGGGRIEMSFDEAKEYKNEAMRPSVFHYLLSKHFDLFGLIDSNQAIDRDNQ